MGAHPDHLFHKAFHNWRERAREAERQLEHCQRQLDAADRHIINLTRRIEEHKTNG